jgi:hypothetical protein
MLAIYTEQKCYPQRFKDAPFVISERSSNEKKRFQALLRFEGPDTRTVQALQKYTAEWELDPAQFWAFSQPEIIVRDPLASMAMYYQRLDQARP